MKRVYRTALGRSVDMDTIRLANEEILAVGNMSVNARGDEIGPGGEIVRSRNQVMAEYYQTDPDGPAKVDEQAVYQQIHKEEQRRQTTSRSRGSMARRVLDDQDGER